MQLSNRVKTQRIKVDGTNFQGAAGTTDLTSDVIDSAGWEGVRFIVQFGAITAGAVTSIKAQGGSDSGGVGASDIAGTGQTVLDTDDNKVKVIDIFRPAQRYLNLFTDRGTQNAVIDSVIVEYYGKHGGIPITEDTNTAVEMFVSPALGTA